MEKNGVNGILEGLKFLNPIGRDMLVVHHSFPTRHVSQMSRSSRGRITDSNPTRRQKKKKVQLRTYTPPSGAPSARTNAVVQTQGRMGNSKPRPGWQFNPPNRI